VTVVTPPGGGARVALRHRRDAAHMSAEQMGAFREAIAAAQKLRDSDNRSYQYWSGIHGLPLPESCHHHDDFFLPWHRAYLYFFEKELQDRVPGVTLPWWNWVRADPTAKGGLPAAYKKAPLVSSPIQPSGRRMPSEKQTWRQERPPTSSYLPTAAQVKQVFGNSSYIAFQGQLENLHNGLHLWVSGTMEWPSVAAYDPIFWAHHTMIDRLWYLWQLEHPGIRFSEEFLETALPPFKMTVRQTLDINRLGYDYAVATAAVDGPTRG
jgi:tyrosinase